MRLKNLPIIFLLLCTSQLHAQSCSELGFFEQAYASFFNTTATDIWQILATGIQYKHTTNGRTFYRLGIAGAWLITGYDNPVYHMANDTFNFGHTSSVSSIYMPVISAGVERQKKLIKHVKWSYGGDINVGYNPRRKDSGDFYDEHYYSIGTWVDSASQRVHKRENIVYASLRPFAGIKAVLSNFSIGLEASTLIIDDLLFINKHASTVFTGGGVDLQLFASYSIKAKRKKTEAKQDKNGPMEKPLSH